MDKSILDYILGGLTINYVLAFYFFSIFGMLFTMTLHYRHKRKKEAKKFNLSYWLIDNWARIVGNLMAVFIVLRFTSELLPDMKLNMWLGLLVGLSIDLIVIGIRKHTKINIFQAKK